MVSEEYVINFWCMRTTAVVKSHNLPCKFNRIQCLFLYSNFVLQNLIDVFILCTLQIVLIKKRQRVL